MLFTINKEQAYELAGVADACSTDGTRPILGWVELMFFREDITTLRAVATDSYVLAKREIEFRGEDALPDETDEKIEKAGGVYVIGKDWKKALKEAAAERSPIDLIYVDIAPDAVTIAREGTKAPEVTIPTQTDGSYPQWEKLLNPGNTSGEFSLPAFNPTYLARVEKVVSAKPSDRSSFPIQLAATKTNGEAQLAPWRWELSHGGSHLTVLVMPMRTGRAA